MPWTEQVLISGDRSRPCEDTIIALEASGEALYAVLDGGASELVGVDLVMCDASLRTLTGGEWIVRAVTAAATRRMRNPVGNQPLMELVKMLETEAMADILRRTDIQPWQRPACAGIFVRITRHTVDWVQFGNCLGFTRFTRGRSKMLGKDRLSQYDMKVNKYMTEHRSRMSDPTVQKMLVDNRRMRNHRGYAVLDGNLNPKLCVCGAYPRSTVRELLLFSDGVFHNKLFDPRWFSVGVHTNGLLRTVEFVRCFEVDDCDYKVIPRFKLHDDKAALRIVF